MSNFIHVYGRIRPKDKQLNEVAVQLIDNNRVRIEVDKKETKIYELHRFFGPDSKQFEVFEIVGKKIVEDCTEGINGTIFAYGQTGSGKTHTMLGSGEQWNDPEAKGIIPRSIEYLFEQLDKKKQICQKFSYTVKVEFVELYNETIYDLLNCSKNTINLRDFGSEIILNGAISEDVESYLDLMNVVRKGWESRKTAETAMNRDSSRSHALLIIKITTNETTGTLLTTRKSTLNLVDLAGSERQSHTKASGERLKEANHINGSLVVLGRCIRILAENSGNGYVPLRDSYLTHILKNSLGGNSRTSVIVNMHPDNQFTAETISTLMFASACAMIKNNVIKNEEMSGDEANAYKEAIRQLRIEMDEQNKKHLEEKNRIMDETEERISKWKNEVKRLKIENERLEISNKQMEKHEPKNCTVSFVENFEPDFRPVSTNRRRTRNPRRETIYAPSPARKVFESITFEEDSSAFKEKEEEKEETGKEKLSNEKFEELMKKLNETEKKLEKALEELEKNEKISEVDIEFELEKSNSKIKIKEKELDELKIQFKKLSMKIGEMDEIVELKNKEIKKLKNLNKIREEELNKEIAEIHEYYRNNSIRKKAEEEKEEKMIDDKDFNDKMVQMKKLFEENCCVEAEKEDFKTKKKKDKKREASAQKVGTRVLRTRNATKN